MNNLLRLIAADPFSGSLDSKTQYCLARSEDAAQKLENKYVRKFDEAFKEINDKAIKALEQGRQPDLSDLEIIIGEMFFETYFKAIKIAQDESELDKKQRLASKLFPKGFATIQKWYDYFKKKKQLPPAQKKMYEGLKKEYLKKTRAAWDKYGEAYRTGKTASRVEAAEEIRKAAQTTVARSKTIARTETTNGYNATRKAYFDRSPEVTHYLFLAVRDLRTTSWCTPKTIQGLRGRHGLVYAKDDPLCAKETPACHWNCRSTFVPLTPFNPNHKRFIENKSIQRRTHQCYPLPKGWRSPG